MILALAVAERNINIVAEKIHKKNFFVDRFFIYYI